LAYVHASVDREGLAVDVSGVGEYSSVQSGRVGTRETCLLAVVASQYAESFMYRGASSWVHTMSVVGWLALAFFAVRGASCSGT